MVCIAGKNNIAVSISEHILNMHPSETLCVCLNNNDDGTDGWQKSLKKFALEHSVKVVSLDEIYNICDLVFISLEFDKIIKPEKFQSKKLYNIHFSLLPKYKGVYTSAWPILNNESESGVTLHKIDAGIDTGDIIAQAKIKIDIKDTSRDLYLKYIEFGTVLVKKYLNELIFSDEIKSQPQNKYLSSYYSKKSINYGDLKIDLNKTAIEIYNQIRAFSFQEYQMPIIYNNVVYSCDITDVRSRCKPGTIIDEYDNIMMVATVDYDITLHTKDKL